MTEKGNIEIEIDLSKHPIHVNHPTCSKGHSLICENVKIHDYPSIKVKASYKDNNGFLYIDPIYGSFDNIIEGMHVPDGEIIELFCPQCNENLKALNDTCQVCLSPMFLFHLPNNGIVEGCLKKGCMFHKLKIVDAEEQITRLFEERMLL
ncbi:MAG: hypothetical protein KKF62_14915 [Bacteroidetes bacterium]|nr:hypothetical protein [Bacteroidota bacterium]MBU1113986.1 hypothetical protein [Bacteroidota bacterium]MBU1800260.1 hypothetical protein [Bacteroidota bacterium]